MIVRTSVSAGISRPSVRIVSFSSRSTFSGYTQASTLPDSFPKSPAFRPTAAKNSHGLAGLVIASFFGAAVLLARSSAATGQDIRAAAINRLAQNDQRLV